MVGQPRTQQQLPAHVAEQPAQRRAAAQPGARAARTAHLMGGVSVVVGASVLQRVPRYATAPGRRERVGVDELELACLGALSHGQLAAVARNAHQVDEPADAKATEGDPAGQRIPVPAEEDVVGAAQRQKKPKQVGDQVALPFYAGGAAVKRCPRLWCPTLQ